MMFMIICCHPHKMSKYHMMTPSRTLGIKGTAMDAKSTPREQRDTKRIAISQSFALLTFILDLLLSCINYTDDTLCKFVIDTQNQG